MSSDKAAIIISNPFSNKNFNPTAFSASNDLDDNDIHDQLDDLIKQNVEQTRLLLILDNLLESAALRRLQSLSLSQMTSWKDFGVVGGDFYLQDIPVLLQIPGVKFIEPSFRSHALLLESTQQLRVRPNSWDLGLEGSSTLSTAICDTGIDDSHPDFAGRIVAWQDFVGEDVSSSGDEYLTPTDRNGHGTLVASILAGSGEASEQGSSNITAAGLFDDTDPDPNEDGIFYISFSLKEAENISLEVIYHGSGVVDSDIRELVGPNDWKINRTLGSRSSNFTWTEDDILPGDYVAVFHGSPSLRGNRISVQLQTNRNDANRTYSKIYRGIAPQTQIVSLKVLDDYGNGDSEDLLDAFDWIKDHRDDYNISVINLSLGFDVVSSAIDRTVESLTNDFGLVVVAAAGNLGPDSGGIYSPGSAEEAITVGAINAANEVAFYSSIGSSSRNGQSMKPDILAPGGSFATSGSSAPLQAIVAADSNDGDEADDLYTDAFEGLTEDQFPNDYFQVQGTSMAAPHASGVAQLLIQALSEQNEWNWSAANALRVKMLMSIATYEVFGQGAQGGETYQNATQEPTVDRTDKDYTEGWGAILADTAISAITTSLAINDSVPFLMGNEIRDSKVYITKMNLSQSDRISLYLEVPSQFDLDLLIFGPTPNSYGEPNLVGSSINPNSGVDEIVNTTAATSGDYFIAVRWVSGAGLQTVHLHADPDFTPGPSSTVTPTFSSSSSLSSSAPSKVASGLPFQFFLLILGILVILRRRTLRNSKPR
ncbi:MAG: S8 family serine peptidase [Candidatus Heimdallarchaeota archaeon]